MRSLTQRTGFGIRDSGFEQPAGVGIRTAHSERVPNPKSQIPTLNAVADTADGIRDSGFGIRTAHSERIPNPKSQIPTLNAIADTAVGIRASGFEQAAGFGIRTAQSERIPNPKS